MPPPINSPRTRVIETDHGYVAQICCDGLTWFDMPEVMQFDGLWNDELADVTYYATRMAMATQALPSNGRVVWVSNGK